MRVTINNYSHTFSSDVGMLLVGPAGSIYLQDNAGDAGLLSNVTFTFSDTGATRLPQSGAWTAGTYRPTSFFSDSFPAPAPAGPHGNPGPTGGGVATLSSTFAGTGPNGTWSLYVKDFASGDGGSIAGGWSIDITTSPSPTSAGVLDFDGDGRTDDGVVRNAGGALQWFNLRSAAGFGAVAWGVATDSVVPGDYDGDGRWDIAVFRSGVFYILRSSTNSLQSIVFGLAGDFARSTQDYDGDGKADPTVVRNVGGSLVFYILRSSAGFTAVSFGLSTTDIPLRGDFDGDGKADIAVFRRPVGMPGNTFFILPSGGGPLISRTFGNYNIDFIIPGDFDGDHKTDVAVFRFSGTPAGTWFWLRSSDGAFASVPFGISGDGPVPGDYDGDGRTDPSVWRGGSPGSFYHLGSTVGFSSAVFGTAGDEPTGFMLQAN